MILPFRTKTLQPASHPAARPEPRRLPRIDRIAARLVVLKLTWKHVDDLLLQVEERGLPLDVRHVDPEAAERSRRAVVERLEATGAWRQATPAERRFLRRRHDDDHDLVQASWRAESATCLAWALGLVGPLPPFDEQVPPDGLDAVPADPRAIVAHACPASRDDVERLRRIAEAWTWRARIHELEQQGFDPSLRGGPTWPAILARGVAVAQADGAFEAPVDGDYPVDGRPYGTIKLHEWGRLRSIAIERLRAFNWLSGRAPGHRWDCVPLDT